MSTRTQFCCFPIEIAVRIIGTVTLIVYAFVFTLLCSGVKDVLKNVKIRIVLGVDSRFFPQPETEQINWFPVSCLIFCAVSMVSSTLLIGSSITKQRILTVPWLICAAANILAHLGSFALLSMSAFSSCDKWVTVTAVLFTVLMTYFSVIVVGAQYSWKSKVKRFIQPRSQDIWEDIFRPPPPPAESPYKSEI